MSSMPSNWLANGCPKTIWLDDGPEFIRKELDLWAFMRGVALEFSRPGKSTDNAFIESLAGEFRAECQLVARSRRGTAKIRGLA
jgi:transposase InsO family protein